MRNQLAVQLYTLHKLLGTEAGFASSLEKISAIGYPAVQLSAVGAMNGESPEVSAERARQLLDDNGLKCIATHRSWDSLAKNTEFEIEFHQTLGCDFTAIGGLPGEYGSRGFEGYQAFLVDSAPVIAKLKAAGIRFGYHNHAHEFQRAFFKDGFPYTFYDEFIENGGPDFLLEVDVYWVSHGGANPETVMRRAAGRVPVIHVKDKEVEGNESFMAPIGEGNLDWRNLIPACDAAGVEWYAVEQDVCRRDPFDCLKSSFEFLTQGVFGG